MDQASLNGIYKGFNKSDEYEELMRQMQRAHITVQGCFVFGFDHDTTDVFRATVERVQELQIDIPRYSIYTPYPGTKLFGRLEAEGRLLSTNWSEYDTMHVVFRPKQMSPVELYEGFRWAYRETFKLGRIFRRAVASGRLFPITFVGNLAYRIFVRRLRRGRGFELPSAAGAQALLPPHAANEPPMVALSSMSCGGAGVEPGVATSAHETTDCGCGRRAAGAVG